MIHATPIISRTNLVYITFIIYIFFVNLCKTFLNFEFYKSVLEMFEITKNVGNFCGEESFFAIKIVFDFFFGVF